jgi:hypothetical protein
VCCSVVDDFPGKVAARSTLGVGAGGGLYSYREVVNCPGNSVYCGCSRRWVRSTRRRPLDEGGFFVDTAQRKERWALVHARRNGEVV